MCRHGGAVAAPLLRSTSSCSSLFKRLTSSKREAKAAYAAGPKPTNYVCGERSVKREELQRIILEHTDAETSALNEVIVCANWISDSVTQGKLLPTKAYEIIVEDSPLAISSRSFSVLERNKAFPHYACQRRTPLTSPNDDIIAPLLELESFYEALGEEARALSYRQAAAVLKAWPSKVTSSAELLGVHIIGKRMCENIDELLESGQLERLETLKGDPRACSLKTLSSIHGVGPATACEWVRNGIHSVEDAKRALLSNDSTVLTWEQRLGLTHYDDLLKPIPRNDVAEIAANVRRVLTCVCAEVDSTGDLRFEVCGSYRRGKPLTSDVDILAAFRTSAGISAHAELMQPLADALVEKDLLLTLSLQEGTHFRRSEGLKKLPPEYLEKHRILMGIIQWRGVHRRIDIVIVPWKQWPYAVLGWSGSRMFERSIRRYAFEVLNVRLSQNGMASNVTGLLGEYETEEEIFAAIGLEYLPPELRNA